MITHRKTFHTSKCSALLEVRLVFRMPPYLNILCTRSEKPHYTKNTNYFKHGDQLLHTLPSKFTINANYEHQSVYRNSTCLPCTVDSTAALLNSKVCRPFYCILAYRNQQSNTTLFRRSLSQISQQYNFCCKFQS